MTQARELARNVAMATARKKQTKFNYEFDRIWHELNGYPKYSKRFTNSTRKVVMGGKKRGATRWPLG